MKKRNFITGFSAAFAALITLASCGGIRAKDGVVLTINGKEFTAEELFKDQTSAASAEAKFNAVYKVAVRKYFETAPGSDYMSEITRDTKNKVAGAKAEASSNASKNGTKYDAEWKKILSSNGVDDETGLYNKFEYDLMKTKFEDVFYEHNYDVLRNGGFFHEKDGTKTTIELKKGYLQEKLPYHMKHILVKIGAKDKDNTGGEITAKEAENIYKVISMLANGSSFEQVSDLYNEDTTAKKTKGSLGIMSTDTSFVNDFKLGTYMYDAFYGTSTSNVETKKGLGLLDDKGEVTEAGAIANKINEFNDPTTTTESTTFKGIGQIPYGEVLKLASSKELKDVGVGDIDFDNTTIAGNFAKYNLNSSNVKAKYLPRNVIFNKYFNKHNIMVITPTDAPSSKSTFGNINDYAKIDGEGSSRKPKLDDYQGELNATYQTYSGFKYKANPTPEEIQSGWKKSKNNDDIISSKLPASTNNQVLRDNNGRVILVFRSGSGSSSNSNADSGYQGIHFVVIERSPFIDSEEDKGSSGTIVGSTSLKEYYTEYYPLQVGGHHPTYTEGGTDYKHTFTNWIMNDPEITNQKTRSDTVKSELKKANDNLNTYVYDYLVTKGDLKFSATADAQQIKTSIDNWIKYTKREASEEDKQKKWVDTWQTYYDSLQAQAAQRKEIYDKQTAPTTVISRLVPEICVDAFQSKNLGTLTLKNLFGEGGVFHD